MDDLVAFLKARLDEDEKWAQITKGVADASGAVFAFALQPDVPMMPTPDDPSRMLREVAAKRAILAEFEEAQDFHSRQDEVAALYFSLRQLATVYATHPDYKPEWKP